MRAPNDEPNPWPAFEYEVWMFFRTRALLAEHAYNEHPESRVLDNALEESALIHTRILVDALLNRSSRWGMLRWMISFQTGADCRVWGRPFGDFGRPMVILMRSVRLAGN